MEDLSTPNPVCPSKEPQGSWGRLKSAGSYAAPWPSHLSGHDYCEKDNGKKTTMALSWPGRQGHWSGPFEFIWPCDRTRSKGDCCVVRRIRISIDNWLRTVHARTLGRNTSFLQALRTTIVRSDGGSGSLVSLLAAKGQSWTVRTGTSNPWGLLQSQTRGLGDRHKGKPILPQTG